MVSITGTVDIVKKPESDDNIPLYGDLPHKMLETRFQFDIDQVMKHLQSKIFGQAAALRAIEDMLKIVKADIGEPDTPLYIAMFLGPTGVGKTETVKVLAEAIHGSHEAFCRVDMNTLALDHYAAALTGAPPGYVGSKEGSTILDKEKIEGSFSKLGIILFDEIEKASPQVIQTLLNIFDNGIMNMASGEQKIDFRNTIIFMTSNLGAREIYEFIDKKFTFLLKQTVHKCKPAYWGIKDDGILIKKIVEKKVEKRFNPEFINRIHDVIIFNWLDLNTSDKLIELLLEQLNIRLKKHNCQVRLEKSAREFLVHQGFDKHFGGRALKRAIRHYLEVPVSEMLIEQQYSSEPVTYIGETDQKRIVLTRNLMKGGV